MTHPVPFPSWAFPLSLGILSAMTAAVLALINTTVPDPYMDEVFHVPQAEKYCSGNFTHWDNKITTLPGLYLLSIGILRPLGSALFGSPESLCSTFSLRSINSFLSLATALVINRILIQIHGERHVR